MRFDTRPADTFLLVGVSRDLVLSPRSHLGGMIYCFLVLENGERLHFIHRTVVDEVPSMKIDLLIRNSDVFSFNYSGNLFISWSSFDWCRFFITSL